MIEDVLRLLFQSTVAASLLIIVLLVLRKAFRGSVRPTWQYAAWSLVLIRLLIPVNIPSPVSVMNLIQPPAIVNTEAKPSGLQTLPAPLVDPYSEQPSHTAAQGIIEENTNPLIEKIGLSQMLFVLWIIGVFTVFTYMAFLNRIFLRRLRQSAQELTGEQIPFYDDLCRQVGIKRPLPLVLSHQLPSPCLIGLFRPYIAITPEAMGDRTILRHVLLHELCHFQQKDHLFSLLRNICCGIYWFNPLVWVAALASRDDSELSCDERVLRYLDEIEGFEYGHTLLTLFRSCYKKAPILHTATEMTNRESSMKTRISMIIHRPRVLKAVAVLALGLVFLLGVMTLTGAQEDGRQNPAAKNQAIGNSGLPSAKLSPLVNQAGAKRALDLAALRLLAKGKLTFNDIINGYKADKVVQDENYNYTGWEYALDNDLRFDLRYIQEKNLPDRYTASLLNKDGSNYIFFPCRPESLERFLSAGEQGNEYYLKAYASFDGKKIAEIEYDKTKQQSESLKILEAGKTYNLYERGYFGRVCWSPDSAYGACINMTTLNGREGRDHCAYLYDSSNHQVYELVDPKIILSAFNELGTFDKEVASIYLHPRIQWSPDSKKLLLSCSPAMNDNHVAAYVVYDVASNRVEDIVMDEIDQTEPSGLTYWTW